MKILVFSDSHGNEDNMIRAVERERPFTLDAIVHLGDGWRDAEALHRLYPRIPLEQVPGNCDLGRFEERERVVFFGDCRVLLCHGHTLGVKSSLLRASYEARERGAQALLYGHTHIPHIDYHDGLWLVNPGSIGDHRRPSYGVLTVEGDKLSPQILLWNKNKSGDDLTMPSEPLIALALSLLISLAPFLPAAEKSAPEEEPARVVEEQPALSAEQLAALAQTPASWFDEPALLDALSKLPHYDETRAQRYLAYRTGGVWTLEQVLRIVNTDNDLPRFTAAVDADPDDGDLILVNKYSRLASDYVPEDLVTVEPAYSNGGKLKSEVNDAFCDLVEAMWAETGLHLVNASPYRSYQTQKNLYARYRTQYSEATTDRFSARAGYSEHQTGLALDVIAPGGTLNGFKNTQQFVWMRDNAHRFGFILRYGDGMEYITGYKFEPWHYRYVGVDAATFIYENDLTFEEYYAYYVKK